MKTTDKLLSLVIASLLFSIENQLNAIAGDEVTQIGKHHIAIQYHEPQYQTSKVEFEIKSDDENQWEKIAIQNGQSLLLGQCDKMIKSRIQTSIGRKLSVETYDLTCGERYAITWDSDKKAWTIYLIKPLSSRAPNANTPYRSLPSDALPFNQAPAMR